MKKNKLVISYLLLLLLIAHILIACNNKTNIDELNFKDTSNTYINKLFEEKYDDIYNNYSYTEKLKESLNPTALKKIKEQLTNNYGDFKKIENTISKQDGNFIDVTIVCKFEKNSTNIHLIFTEKKEIAGINLTDNKK